MPAMLSEQQLLPLPFLFRFSSHFTSSVLWRVINPFPFISICCFFYFFNIKFNYRYFICLILLYNNFLDMNACAQIQHALWCAIGLCSVLNSGRSGERNACHVKSTGHQGQSLQMRSSSFVSFSTFFSFLTLLYFVFI